MKTSNVWFKALDTIFGYLLLPLGFVAFLVRKAKNSEQDFIPSKLLVVKLCCLGDSILSLIALISLRAKYPYARIAVLCSRRNNWIYERSGLVDEVIVFPISGLSGWRELYSLPIVLRQFIYLFKQKDEVVIDFDIYYRFTTLLSMFPGRKVVAGYISPRGIDRTLFYDHRTKRDNNLPEWQNFFKLLEPFKLEISNNAITLTSSPIESNLADKMILAIKHKGKVLIAVVPGSSENWPEKRWSPHAFAAAMRLLAKEIDAVFVIIGTKEEFPVTDQMVKMFNDENRVVNLAGKTTPGVLISLMSKINGMISNDTGPMHLAALMGVPVVGLFGPTNERKWSPPAKKFIAITSACSKRPCDQISRLPNCSGSDCMSSIQPEMVATALIELLNSVGLKGNE